MQISRGDGRGRVAAVEKRSPFRRVVAGLTSALLVGSAAVAITTLDAFVAPDTAAAAPSQCSVAANGSFEDPNIQDPANPQPGDQYVNGYNQWRTSQATISGWQTVAGTIDILRYFNNASDGAQSVDLWGTAPATVQQTFSGLTPGVEYSFSVDYSGLEAANSRATVQLSQGGAFSTVATLTPSADAVSNGGAGGTPTTPTFTVTWSTFEYSFVATGTSAVVRLQNQVAPARLNTGLFIDNFQFVGGVPCEDYGDAPESYGTSVATNGPAHLATGPTIGSVRDAEWDGQPDAAATGDDTAGTPDDEDGVGALTFDPAGASVTVPVSVSGTTVAATLYGWIDTNGNGRFDASEFVSTAVAAGASTVDLTFSGQPLLVGGTDYMMRLRLTTDALSDDAATPVDERALGAASDGEVEDHLVTVPVLPGLSVEKSATPDSASAVGDDITYSFVVTNTGNVPVTNVTVDEGEFTGTGELSEVVCADGAASLAPGATVTCTATYELTQADVNAGSVSNTATVTGTPPSGPPPVSPPSTSVVQIPPASGLSVVKSATPSAADDFVAGQEIDYSFVLTNTGNTTITNATVTETAFTGTGDLSDVVCPAGAASLAPGEQVVCTADYTLTQADIDAGSVTNVATGTGTPPSGPPPVSPPSEVTIPNVAAPALEVVKTADAESIVDAGQEITYSFRVSNTGNVTLDELVVNETGFSGTGDLGAVVCPTEILVPGQFIVCTASYTVTQADVDAGGDLVNTATAGGTTPDGDSATSVPSTSAVPIDQAPALSMVKTSDVVAAAVGQTVTYSFLITNTGNVTITDPTVNESAFSGTGELSAIVCPEEDTLAPDAAITCTASYVVTQADVDAGQLRNTATATGTTPGGTPTDPSVPSENVVTTDPLPALAVVKEADLERVTAAGQLVTYSFVVSNIGNVTLTDPTVNEGAFSGNGTLSAVTCPDGALAPGESITCTATYRVVAADLSDGGELTNTATASATTPGGDTITSAPSTASVQEVRPPSDGGLAVTGGTVAWPVAGVALMLIIAGSLIVLARRREITTDA